VNKKHIPNLISVFRIILVMPIAYYLWTQNYLLALIFFFSGAVSDGLDGYLARRYKWESELGVILDPMGDKLMMVTSYMLLGWHTLLPWWLVALVILRDIVIVIGTLLYQKFIGTAQIKPLLVSKLNTVFQMLLVVIVMLAQVTPLPVIVITGILWLVVATTLMSGYAYINEWGRRAWRVLHKDGV